MKSEIPSEKQETINRYGGGAFLEKKYPFMKVVYLFTCVLLDKTGIAAAIRIIPIKAGAA